MNKMLQQSLIALTIFKCLYSVSAFNLIVEQNQWFTDPAADVHSSRLTNYLSLTSYTMQFHTCLYWCVMFPVPGKT